jgi:predicted nucleic acid-binding protein
MGLFRRLTNPRVLPGKPCTVKRPFAISKELLMDRRTFFESEPPDLESAWAALMQHPAAGISSWTDAYLAAFAQQDGYHVATFDRGFQRWTDLRLSLLSRP